MAEGELAVGAREQGELQGARGDDVARRQRDRAPQDLLGLARVGDAVLEAPVVLVEGAQVGERETGLEQGLARRLGIRGEQAPRGRGRLPGLARAGRIVEAAAQEPLVDQEAASLTRNSGALGKRRTSSSTSERAFAMVAPAASSSPWRISAAARLMP